MKKLMIAAAAAAMIGGAFAVTAEYDFVAYLTTTTGQSGQDVYTAFAGNVGVNDAGTTMWYMDGVFANTTVDNGTPGASGYVGRQWTTDAYPHLQWTLGESLEGRKYPTLKVATDTATGLPLVNDAEATLLAGLVDEYDNPSYGNWCGYFAWYTKVEKQCFRVFGADSINTKLYLNTDECCVRGRYNTRAFRNANGDKAIDFGANEVENGFADRFGAQSGADAIYLETYARVDNVQTVATKFDFRGFLAGQGTVAMINADTRAPAQFSGNIVGYTRAPECPDCCVRPLPAAIAFDCNFDDLRNVRIAGRGNVLGAEPTAAFGTFYVQYVGIAP